MLAFFDSDTQNDFILSTGRFPVPGAENMRKNLKRLTDFGRRRKIPLISSVDRHFGTPKYRAIEMNELDIWGGPFPLHCMDGTPGQKKIRETSPKRAAFFECRNYSGKELNSHASKHTEFVLEKQTFSAFSNPNTEKLLRLLKVSRSVLYGVSTDYSLRSAALGMRRLGIDVYLVTDAAKGINFKPPDSEISIRQMFAAGVLPTTTENVLKDLAIKK